MAKRRKEKRTYKYSCNLTGEEFVLTKKVDNPDDLMSVKAYYEMNPEDDDRPEDIKKMIDVQEKQNEAKSISDISDIEGN